MSSSGLVMPYRINILEEADCCLTTTLHGSPDQRFERVARLEYGDKKVLTERSKADRLTDIRCEQCRSEKFSSLDGKRTLTAE